MTSTTVEKSSTSTKSIDEQHLVEATPKDRSRSHSVFEAGDKSPVSRSRTGSLYEDKIAEKLSLAQEATGASASSKRGSTSVPKEDAQADETVIEKDTSRKSSVVDPATKIVEEKLSSKMIIDEGVEKVPEGKRVQIEIYISDEYIEKKRRLNLGNLEEIASSNSLSLRTLIIIIEELLSKKKMQRKSVLEDEVPEAQNFVDWVTDEKKTGELKVDEKLSQPESTRSSVASVMSEYGSGKASGDGRISPYDADGTAKERKLETSKTPSPEPHASAPEKYDLEGFERPEPCIDEEVTISEDKRIEVESHIVEEYVKKGKVVSESELEKIIVKASIPKYLVLEIIEEIILKKNISRDKIVDKALYLDRDIEEQEDIDRKTPDYSHSGHHVPPASAYSSAADFESQFHKAFVGGMTEIRTTHITTLSEKSTPEFPIKDTTVVQTSDKAHSELGSQETKDQVEEDIAKQVASVSGIKDQDTVETVIKESKTVITEIFKTIDGGSGAESSAEIKTVPLTKENLEKMEAIKTESAIFPLIKDIISEASLSGKSSPDISLPKDSVHGSTGKSTPDIPMPASPLFKDSQRRQSRGSISDKKSDVPSRTSTPEGFRAGEIIKTTITTTRTMSDDGDIITTTQEVTESTNEKGETVLLAEKTNVKVEEQVKTDDLEEFEMPAAMSSSFYGELPTVTGFQAPPLHFETGGDSRGEQGDFSFKKFTVEKEYKGTYQEKTGESKRYVDDGDLDFEKALTESKEGSSKPKEGTSKSPAKEESKSPDKKDKKDPIEGWGSPLGLPSPTPPHKFSFKGPIHSNSTTDDAMHFNFNLEEWGEPLGLPTPAPVSAAPANENSEKAEPGTPKKERKQVKKVITENLKNKKRSESPIKIDKKMKDSKNKIQPVYVDLTYVPHHGNSFYTSLEFFKKVRARYYVFSGTEPSRDVYDALLEAKRTWEDKNLGKFNLSSLILFQLFISN